jgi:hypothetical protein
LKIILMEYYSQSTVVSTFASPHQPMLRPKPAKELAFPIARQTEKIQQK